MDREIDLEAKRVIQRVINNESSLEMSQALGVVEQILKRRRAIQYAERRFYAVTRGL